MRRIRIITTAILLAIIGAILPMVAALFLAWSQAFNEERQKLYEFSTRMLTRAQHTLNEARKLFPLLQKQDDGLRPCSKEHIKWMEELTTSIIDIKAIAYFENGIERCNSFGVSNAPIPRNNPSDFILDDGLEFVIGRSSNSSTSLVALRKGGNYDIYVDPKRFSDIIIPGEIQLAIVYNKQLLTAQRPISPALFKKIFAQIGELNLNEYFEVYNGRKRLKPIKALEQKHVFFADKKMISISQYGPFSLIAVQPESLVYKRYRRLQFILLPFGFITAAFIVGLVIYYSLRRLSFLAELQEALRLNEFIVHYQPIIHTLSGKCGGAEALIRWQRPNGEIVRPDLFIPYAEESGIITAITDKVIDKIFAEMEAFLVKNRTFHIAINVGVNDIQTGRIIEVLESKIAKSKILRNQIWIELTERTFLELEKTKPVVQQARQLGYLVVVDDFGTGFSNLSYLQNLPMDILKIDKSFIDSLGMESATSNVTKHIIDMAKSLNLRLVAEGVEKQEQYNYLKERNVDYIQGYFFSKPLPFQEFMRFCGFDN
ncbi:EAL domain-containing protein [Legionella cardiaca]|uniref:cyclic-guanylate-specific phosphodiesterase n=1 Tax=Legionella cardiaca TaxID=1071983 RepID=A0ABY8AWJ7_9GAMM|nr:EAL domain-containing protein [Legionella cardiaca]WED43527.1 EAL domain-containing protein [Legionella cardiaca]